MIIEHWYNNTDRGKPSTGRKTSHSSTFHSESHMAWPGIQLRPNWGQTSDQLPEAQHSQHSNKGCHLLTSSAEVDGSNVSLYLGKLPTIKQSKHITWTHVCVWCSPQPSHSVPWILWWVMRQPCWPGSHCGHGRSTEADHTELKHKKTLIKLALRQPTDIMAHKCKKGLVRYLVSVNTVSANFNKLCTVWLRGEGGHCHSSNAEDQVFWNVTLCWGGQAVPNILNEGTTILWKVRIYSPITQQHISEDLNVQLQNTSAYVSDCHAAFTLKSVKLTLCTK